MSIVAATLFSDGVGMSGGGPYPESFRGVALHREIAFISLKLWRKARFLRAYVVCFWNSLNKRWRMGSKYIIALDQGTTSSRCLIFDRNQDIIGGKQKEFAQHFPQDGWVEHDPLEIVATTIGVMEEAVQFTGINPADVAGIGITNQRETTVVWERETGRPIMNAIVWQCRRTAGICDRLVADGMTDYVRATTGLLIDAYFSATKIQWILDNVPGARERAKDGELLFGTVDSWLLWNLTHGAVHATDRTNASRTMLMDLRTLNWDQQMLDILDIPRAMLPEIRSSSEVYGYCDFFGTEIPIAGIAGDQQAALFGQACFRPGQAKNTYGTGCFLLMNLGSNLVYSDNGLITTLAATPRDEVQYAIEGSVFMGGAVMQWLRDDLRLIRDTADSEYYARKVADNGGVYLVPAFTGLGAPEWDMYARGTIVGLTRGSNADHIIRAGLESIAFQVEDVIEAMEKCTDVRLSELKVDGGASCNNFLMQFQANITDRDVLRPRIRETTALGAAYLAGLAVGMWTDREEIERQWTLDEKFSPAMPAEWRRDLLHNWHRAVERAHGWIEE